MIKPLVSCLFWLFLTLSSIALFPVAVLVWAVTAPFDRRKVALHLFTCFWASLYTWLNPAWPVSITGRDKLHYDQAHIMVSNHLSLIDILVLFRLFTHYKWVSKVENFRVPCIGWNMSLNGYIKLTRGSRQSVAQMLRESEAALAAGNSIMIFPEGTRSATGRMRSFRTGAIDIAIKTGAPIQPLVIDGSADALPKAGFVLQGRHPISVTVLDPIPPEDFGDRSAEELALHVRGLIAQQLEKNSKAREAMKVC
jgi:1-acyl-sn-glycerol-3-phosphate acyltransferase